MNATPPADAQTPELERYGIVRVSTERFDFGGYSYVKLADAVAEAKRRGAAVGDGS